MLPYLPWVASFANYWVSLGGGLGIVRRRRGLVVIDPVPEIIAGWAGSLGGRVGHCGLQLAFRFDDVVLQRDLLRVVPVAVRRHKGERLCLRCSAVKSLLIERITEPPLDRRQLRFLSTQLIQGV